jgi:hypothetical protein
MNSVTCQTLAAELKLLRSDELLGRSFVPGTSNGAGPSSELHPFLQTWDQHPCPWSFEGSPEHEPGATKEIGTVELIQRYVDSFAQLLVDKSLEAAEIRQRNAENAGKQKQAKARAVQLIDIQHALLNDPQLVRIKARLHQMCNAKATAGATLELSSSSSALATADSANSDIGSRKKRAAVNEGGGGQVVHHLFCTSRVEVGCATGGSKSTTASINPLFCKPVLLGLQAANVSPHANPGLQEHRKDRRRGGAAAGEQPPKAKRYASGRGRGAPR